MMNQTRRFPIIAAVATFCVMLSGIAFAKEKAKKEAQQVAIPAVTSRRRLRLSIKRIRAGHCRIYKGARSEPEKCARDLPKSRGDVSGGE